MKVLVCGSRDWQDRRVIERHIDALKDEHGYLTVIEGEARGADALARDVALERNLPVERFPADWKLHGKGAGKERNLLMLDERPDLVLAFQRNDSRGTQHTIDEARRRGIPVEVVSA